MGIELAASHLARA